MQIIILIDLGYDRWVAVIDAVTSNFLLAGCCLLISNGMRYYVPKHDRYWYVLIVSLGFSLVWLLLSRITLWIFLHGNVIYLSQLKSSSNIRFAIAFLINGCMAMMNLLWYTQQEKDESDARKMETVNLAKEAELYKLRQQLQPHFLFNSLNSISALTGSQPENARHMIQQLSDFLRGTLKKDEHQWDTLEAEMQYLQLYLDIEKVRFGYRLQTDIQITEQALQMKLPAMLLQPVVENAIKFGLYDTIGEVVILIAAHITDAGLEVTVQNPYDEETAQPLGGTGFGLASIKRRLFLLFARHDLLTTTVKENNFITKILIPQIN